MEKQGLLPLLAVLGGAAALLLRVWQNATGFEPDTGLPIPDALAGTVLTVFLLAMAVLLFLLVRRLPKEAENAPLLPRDFATEDTRLLALPVAGVLLIGQEATPLRVMAALLVVTASAGVTLTARRGGPEQPQPVDESPGWDLPTPTHATVTGEMPILTAEELHGPARGAEESPGRSR